MLAPRLQHVVGIFGFLASIVLLRMVLGPSSVNMTTISQDQDVRSDVPVTTQKAGMAKGVTTKPIVLRTSVSKTVLRTTGFPVNTEKDAFLSRFVAECKKTPIEQDMLAKGHLPQCPCTPDKMVGRQMPDLSVPSDQDLEAAHPDVEEGGHFQPKTCQARQRACLFIPYRDRESHLRIFLKIMLPFMKKQNMDFRIYVAEQNNGSRFNRGLLMNAAFTQAERDGGHCDCIIIHDVDHVPEDDRNMYFCQKVPIHLAVARNDHKYRLPYGSFVGGAVAMTKDAYKKINGFSNLYFGWGSEDDDLHSRMTKATKLGLMRYPTNIAFYTMFKHEHAVENKGRWKLVRAWKSRWQTDGLNNVMSKCTISKVVKHKLYTTIHVHIDEKQAMNGTGFTS